MGKRKEDEIQEKLIELELSIKEEEAKIKAPNPVNSQQQLLNPGVLSDSVEAKEIAESKLSIDLYSLGGFGLLGAGAFMLMSHIVVGTGIWSLWSHGYNGFMILPMLIGIGMLFYNYKSKPALFVTLGGFGLILFNVLSQLNITFPPLSMIQFVMMATFVCAGGAFLTKAHVKRMELNEKTKAIK